MGEVKPRILIHGGAWAIPDHLAEASVDGVKTAAKVGYSVLEKENGTALDAVEAAICSLEDNPAFDAGTGAVLNLAGDVELDAIIMEGSELRTGSVACVQNIKNPVKLARLVMEKTDHVLLVGQGANIFAREMGVKEVPKTDLVTPEAVMYWERYSKYKVAVDDLFNNKIELEGHDTVGAVAIDRRGNVACGTSTGGITGKRVGRVGDSPVIGSGGYCDNTIGAASTTGHGESIMKVMLARHVLQNIETGLSTQAAAEKSLEYMKQRVGGAGGVIAINNKGEVGKHFTTERMPWATISEKSLEFGIEPEDHFVETIT